MAKKIVRGITDVKTINNQDFDTNNVNDLLSDGQYNYIHRKKGKIEEYHNLTDNIKTISSDNTELLSVTNNNKTTNTATLHPKHDSQKEQLLESTRDTVTIQHGTNGTDEKTTVDTNPEKVLEHENLKTGDGLAVSQSGNETTISIEPTNKPAQTNLDNFQSSIVYGHDLTGRPSVDDHRDTGYITLKISSNQLIQLSVRSGNLTPSLGVMNYRFINNEAGSITTTEWRKVPIDDIEIQTALSQKQNVLTAGSGITIQGNTVDTNPQKVLEHENLISDSEYITLDHQTDDATTHIQTAALKEKLDNLQQTKQNVLTAGDGITIEENVISSTGGGTTTTIKFYYVAEWLFRAFKQVVTNGDYTFVTFTFQCEPEFAARELTGELKQDLEKFVGADMTVSNGAVSISNDGTKMKLMKSESSQNPYQQGTFTFTEDTSGGGTPS